MSMADPWGVLVAGPAAATTEAGDVDGGPPGVLAVGPIAATTEAGDVDGGPPGVCWWQVRQWPPPKLETSMAGPCPPDLMICSEFYKKDVGSNK
jgi:hypothetical protein